MTEADQALILHVINSLGLSGGAEQQLVANLRQFTDEGISHHVAYLYTWTDPSWIDQLPFPVTALNGSAADASRWASAVRLGRLVRALQPDLIHCSLADAALISRLVGSWAGVPVLESLVNISHDEIRTQDSAAVTMWKLRMHRLIDRMTTRRVAAFHALSDEVARSWVAAIGLDPAKITVIPRGVPIRAVDAAALESQERDRLRSDLMGDTEALLILAVGREEPQKGHRYLIEAMPAILESVDAHLVMIGRSGSASGNLTRLVQDLGLSDRVHRMGVRTDVYRVMKAADVMAFPSLYEGLGVALLEGMASGLPVVVFDRAPMNEVVLHDQTGLIVPDRDVSGLATTIATLGSKPAVRERLGQEAVRAVRTGYDLSSTSMQMEALYRSILDTPPSPPLRMRKPRR